MIDNVSYNAMVTLAMLVDDSVLYTSVMITVYL